ncbi:MAG: hypothetical protein OEW00_08295 [candidate division Zixibacteria bacterium]|nr:hypothetical protein [candidate division Zixibacteria bacterium]
MPIIMTMLLSTALLLIETFSQDAAPRGPVINLSFDDSAARYVLEHPASALENERDTIWKTFEGYRITLVWHKESSFPVTWEIWEKGLNRFLEDTLLIRRTLELADSLKSKAQKEKNSIAKHISAYLAAAAPITASVYFVAFTTPYAFCVERNKIGIDITGDEWNFDTDCVLNTVIHEIFHVGYRATTPDLEYLQSEPGDEETLLHFCYAYLQSEGMATYVGYKALDLYPSDYRHDDYELLEEDSKVLRAIGQMGVLLEDAGSVAIDSMLQEVWDIGVTERAFYVAGAYMAKTIEEKHGTEYLARLTGKGGLQFTREYNAIVPDEYRIILKEL